MCLHVAPERFNSPGLLWQLPGLPYCRQHVVVSNLEPPASLLGCLQSHQARGTRPSHDIDIDANVCRPDDYYAAYSVTPTRTQVCKLLLQLPGSGLSLPLYTEARHLTPSECCTDHNSARSGGGTAANSTSAGAVLGVLCFLLPPLSTLLVVPDLRNAAPLVRQTLQHRGLQTKVQHQAAVPLSITLQALLGGLRFGGGLWSVVCARTQQSMGHVHRRLCWVDPERHLVRTRRCIRSLPGPLPEHHQMQLTCRGLHNCQAGQADSRWMAPPHDYHHAWHG